MERKAYIVPKNRLLPNSKSLSVLSSSMCCWDFIFHIISYFKEHFHWENVALKWATLWSVSFCSFAVWLTIHLNKPVAMELPSAHVNEKVYLSLFFTVITFYLFLKASWISAHCSIGIISVLFRAVILIFSFRIGIISVIHFALPFCFGFTAGNLNHFFLCLSEIT
jgi:hypothetical protein